MIVHNNIVQCNCIGSGLVGYIGPNPAAECHVRAFIDRKVGYFRRDHQQGRTVQRFAVEEILLTVFFVETPGDLVPDAFAELCSGEFCTDRDTDTFALFVKKAALNIELTAEK